MLVDMEVAPSTNHSSVSKDQISSDQTFQGRELFKLLEQVRLREMVLGRLQECTEVKMLGLMWLWSMAFRGSGYRNILGEHIQLGVLAISVQQSSGCKDFQKSSKSTSSQTETLTA